MSPDKLYRRWKKRFCGLRDEIDALFGEVLVHPEVEVVHNLRVALRRARLLALAGRPALGREPANEFRHWAFQVMELLGDVRDADVTVEWLEHEAGHRELAARIKARRQQLWRRILPRLNALRIADLKRLVTLTSKGATRTKLHRRFEATRDGFFSRVAADRARFHELDTEAIHEFRRNIRRWRYLNETVMSRREQKASKELRRLVALQDALGEMQNCEVIRHFLHSLHLPATTIRPLDRRLSLQQTKWVEKAGRRLEVVSRFQR
jgi:CHAD domain-containing protein